MTVWSHSTASVDPTSPSSPTPPVGRPKRPPCTLPVRPPLPHPNPGLTRLHSQKSPLPFSLLPASSCGRIYNLQLCVFQEGGNFFFKGCSCEAFWRPTTERELTLSLHFLVVMLYTEQASIRHNERGNVAMLCTNEGHWYEFLKKGPFCIESKQLNINQFQIVLSVVWTKKHHVNREFNVC